MTTVAFVSAKGSPGVTTVACLSGALWPFSPPVIAECDPSGADLAPRFGLATGIGMASIVLAIRQGPMNPDDLERHLQVLPGGLEVLAGPVGCDAAAALDHELAAISFAGSLGRDVLVDCGRFSPSSDGQRRLLRDADVVVLVLRPDASSIAHGRWVAERLASDRSAVHGRCRLIVTGEGPYEPHEMADALGFRLLGSLPWDPAAASVVSGQAGSRRSLERSSLVRAVARIVPALQAGSLNEELRDAS